METVAEDIEYLNSEFLLRACDPEGGVRLLRALEASSAVIQRIKGAHGNGMNSAIRCGVSLVTFSAAADDWLLHVRDARTPRSAEVPQSLRALNLLTLHMAQRLASCDLTLLRLHFGASERAAPIIARLGVGQMMVLAERSASLLVLRGAQSPLFWERLLIGDRYNDPRGTRVSHPAAKLNLAASGLRKALARSAQGGKSL